MEICTVDYKALFNIGNVFIISDIIKNQFYGLTSINRFTGFILVKSYCFNIRIYILMSKFLTFGT